MKDGPNQPQTLTGIETAFHPKAIAGMVRPNQPQTLTGIETHRNPTDRADRVFGPINLKPLQGLKHSPGPSPGHR